MEWIHMAAAFCISALSGMGVGGGGLFVIYLVWVMDTPQLTAQGINLLFFLFSAGASLLIHLQKRKMFALPILLMALFGVLGSLFGSQLATLVEEGILRKIFGTMLVISGILSFKQKSSVPETPAKN